MESLIPGLFRTEFRKITAVLCRQLGIEHLELAEDIASDTFLAALETWPYKGIPENPVAWLYAVARHKAKNQVARHVLFGKKISAGIRQEAMLSEELQLDLSEQFISDSQLQMLFAICHPSLPPEAQTGLALRILCGFGIDEIANAFLSNKETINKRLFRAREKLRAEKIRIEFPPEEETGRRLASVLRTLYLLYNEGYYSESRDSVLREELCLEAMRLAYLLTEYAQTNRPEVNALLALMCFHSSRFAARKDASGELVLYDEQDESLWNQELIAKGADFLQRASHGNTVSQYHLEAGIAYWHTHKADTPEKWDAILQLYNQLLRIAYSPMAALNRTYALAKVKGDALAISEAEKLQLTSNQYYFVLLAELYKNTDRLKAKHLLEQALSLAKTKPDRHCIEKKLAAL